VRGSKGVGWVKRIPAVAVYRLHGARLGPATELPIAAAPNNNRSGRRITPAAKYPQPNGECPGPAGSPPPLPDHRI